jgi:hypothetical protein
MINYRKENTIDIEYIDRLEEKDHIIIDDEFNEYGKESGVACDYKTFNFVAEEDLISKLHSEKFMWKGYWT